MTVTILKGVIKELGTCAATAGVPHSMAHYAYIELIDGRLLRNVSVFGGLDGKLRAALLEAGNLELHVAHTDKSARLLAIRSGDGHLYVSEVQGRSMAVSAMCLALGFCGVMLLPVFGLGLLLIWWAWAAWKGQRLVNSAKRHVDALQGAIIL